MRVKQTMYLNNQSVDNNKYFETSSDLLKYSDKKLNEILKEIPQTYQSPTMSPYCKDDEKYETAWYEWFPELASAVLYIVIPEP